MKRLRELLARGVLSDAEALEARLLLFDLYGRQPALRRALKNVYPPTDTG